VGVEGCAVRFEGERAVVVHHATVAAGGLVCMLTPKLRGLICAHLLTIDMLPKQRAEGCGGEGECLRRPSIRRGSGASAVRSSY
jgi:hypothetical protein